MTTMSPIILSIDGNIGSGKSTLYEDLQKYYKNNDDICFIPEPVDEWHDIVDHEGTPILTNLYKDTKKFAFRFQMMAYISRLNLLLKAIRKRKYKIFITERSVETDKNVFARMLYDDGLIEHDEFIIYNKWFDEFIKEVQLSGIIYIKADPEISNKRVIKRAREGENIPLDYLKKCHDYHEKWLNNYHNKLVINANIDKDLENKDSIIEDWNSKINIWIKDVVRKKNLCDDYVLYFDGACRGNPSDILGLGAIIKKDDKIFKSLSKHIKISNGTNNEAEYYALINGLKLAHENNIKNITIYGDSSLVINQMTRKYNINAANLIPLYKEAKELCNFFESIDFKHLKREFNKEADKLANNSLDMLCGV